MFSSREYKSPYPSTRMPLPGIEQFQVQALRNEWAEARQKWEALHKKIGMEADPNVKFLFAVYGLDTENIFHQKDNDLSQLHDVIVAPGQNLIAIRDRYHESNLELRKVLDNIVGIEFRASYLFPLATASIIPKSGAEDSGPKSGSSRKRASEMISPPPKAPKEDDTEVKGGSRICPKDDSITGSEPARPFKRCMALNEYATGASILERFEATAKKAKAENRPEPPPRQDPDLVLSPRKKDGRIIDLRHENAALLKERNKFSDMCRQKDVTIRVLKDELSTVNRKLGQSIKRETVKRTRIQDLQQHYRVCGCSHYPNRLLAPVEEDAKEETKEKESDEDEDEEMEEGKELDTGVFNDESHEGNEEPEEADKSMEM